MLIKAGFDIAFECPQPTSMLLQLNIHPDREGDLRAPDLIRTEPALPYSTYVDRFGNRVTRIDAPAGLIRFRNEFVIEDSGLLDAAPPEAPTAPISRLPNEALEFLLPSRYCDSDMLGELAWKTFASHKTGAATVRAICEYAHNHITFDYLKASVFRTASGGLSDRVGVCRDYAHLAVSLCRAMNIPARYCTGYLGDIGVPVDKEPMDFSAWFEAYIEGAWYTFDARHNRARIGRIVMARGRDAADVAITTSFGVATLRKFEVTTLEMAE